MEDQDKTKDQLIEELRTCNGRLQSQNEELQRLRLDLDKSRSEYSNLYEFSSVGYFTLDAQGTILKANQIAAVVMGVKKNPIINQPFSRFVFEDDHAIFNFFCEKVRDGHSKQTCGIRLIRGDGSVLNAQLEGMYNVDQKAQQENFVVAVIDHTTNKRLEERISSFKDQWERIFDSIPDPVMILDTEHGIVWANSTTAERLGLTRQQVIGAKCYEAVHGRGEPPDFCPHSGTMQDGQEHSSEITEPKLGGVFDVSLSPLFDAQNRLIGSLHIARDITIRKNIERELKESEERYRNFFKTSRDCVFITSVNGEVTDFNEAWSELLGYEPDEREDLLRIDASHFYANPVERETHTKRIVEKGFYKDYPVDLRKRDGTTINTLITTVCSKDHQGNVIGFQGTIRDITDRKRAEERLRESEEKYRLIFNSSPVGMMHFNSDGIITDCNEKLLEILGASREQAIGFNITTSVTNENVKRAVKSALSGRVGTYEGEYTSATGGKTVWGKIVYTPLTTPQGVVSGGIAIVDDLTERKLAEDSLRASEERFRLIAETITEVFWIADIETGKMFYVSPAYEHVWGQSRESLYKNPKSFVDSIHEQDRERVRSCLEVKKSGKQFELEYRIIGPGGTIRWIFDRGFPVRDQTERVIQYVGVARDITQRKRIEEALRLSEDKYRRIVETASEGIWTMDGAHVTTFVNSMMARMLGCAVEDMIGQKVEHFMFPEDLKDHQGKMEARRQGQHGFYERKFRRADGTTLWTLVSATSVMGSEGEFLGSIAMLTDISQVKSLQSQLLQAQKMEAVGTLAAGIAHDFNNMLQTILGYSEILLDEKSKGEPGYAELQKIVATSIEARDLVQKIRLFSRKADIQPVALDLNHRLADLTKLLSHTLLKTVQLDAHLAEDLGIIKADPALMDQMVTNLAINAFEAMPDGGALTIETHNILLDEDFCRTHAGAKPGPHVLLTIADTGRGMSKDHLDRMFEPFFSTKQRDYHRGTGLGLSIVKGIVDEHGGYITVESEVGKGTTFRIYFPILTSEQKPQAQLETKIEPAATRAETILLVEDEEFVRDLGIKLLERFGYNVIAVANGQDAVEVYAKEKENISLVILDIVMPRMDGKECLQELLKLNPGVKVLISSGVAQQDRVQEVVRLGAKGSLIKPYGMKVLQDKVREVLDSQ